MEVILEKLKGKKSKRTTGIQTAKQHKERREFTLAECTVKTNDEDLQGSGT